MTKYSLIQECRIGLIGHAANVIYHINRLKKESHINVYGCRRSTWPYPIFAKNSQQTRKGKKCPQLIKGHLRKTYGHILPNDERKCIPSKITNEARMSSPLLFNIVLKVLASATS